MSGSKTFLPGKPTHKFFLLVARDALQNDNTIQNPSKYGAAAGFSKETNAVYSATNRLLHSGLLVRLEGKATYGLTPAGILQYQKMSGEGADLGAKTTVKIPEKKHKRSHLYLRILASHANAQGLIDKPVFHFSEGGYKNPHQSSSAIQCLLRSALLKPVDVVSPYKAVLLTAKGRELLQKMGVDVSAPPAAQEILPDQAVRTTVRLRRLWEISGGKPFTTAMAVKDGLGFGKNGSVNSFLNVAVEQGYTKRSEKGNYEWLKQPPDHDAGKTVAQHNGQQQKFLAYVEAHIDDKGEFELPLSMWKDFGYQSREACGATAYSLCKKGVLGRVTKRKLWYRLLKAQAATTSAKVPPVLEPLPLPEIPDSPASDAQVKPESGILELTPREKRLFEVLGISSRQSSEQDMIIIEGAFKELAKLPEDDDDLVYEYFMKKMALYGIITDGGRVGTRGRIYTFISERYFYWYGRVKVKVDLLKAVHDITKQINAVANGHARVQKSLEDNSRLYTEKNHRFITLRKKVDDLKAKLEQAQEEREKVGLEIVDLDNERLRLEAELLNLSSDETLARIDGLRRKLAVLKQLASYSPEDLSSIMETII